LHKKTKVRQYFSILYKIRFFYQKSFFDLKIFLFFICVNKKQKIIIDKSLTQINRYIGAKVLRIFKGIFQKPLKVEVWNDSSNII